MDCLESCLDHLNFEELLNAANANGRLKQAARYVFARMYGKKVLLLSVFKSTTGRRFILSDKKLKMYDLKMALQLLRCFGDLVSEMEIYLKDDYTEKLNRNEPAPYKLRQLFRDSEIQSTINSKYDLLIIEYLNEYCSESLVKIMIEGNPKGKLDKFTKTFKNVEQIRMESSYFIGDTLHQLFPNIRELKLRYYGREEHDKFQCSDFIAYNFPYLEHLDIDTDTEYECYKGNVAIALYSNPQLKSLSGDIWLDVIFDPINLSNANAILQNIETLKLFIDEITHFKPNPDTIIDMKSLKNLHITTKDFDMLSPFPFRCAQLESLQVYFDDCSNAQFYSLISKYPTLKNFDCTIRDGSNINFSRLPKVLPLLEKISIYRDRYSVDKIADFIHQFKSLRVFQYYIKHELVKDLLVRLDKCWTLSSMSTPDARETVKLKMNRLCD